MSSHLIQLIRPRTLPLAFAVTCCGNALAYHHGTWRGSIFFLSLLTAISLQALSNMANDYGDGVRGTDALRPSSAPARLMTTGIISSAQMQKYLCVAVALCVIFGLLLVWLSFQNRQEALLFIFFGLLAIIAAITYTIGRYPYAYYALGEVSVFCFFGLLGVIGNFYLQSGIYTASVLLPAVGSGVLAAAVLHINNMRDLETDYLAGKHTVAGKLGWRKSKIWHLFLVVFALLCYFLYGIFLAPWSLCWLFLIMPIIEHGRRVYNAANPVKIGQELRHIVLLTLQINLLFSLGLILPALFPAIKMAFF